MFVENLQKTVAVNSKNKQQKTNMHYQHGV